jgi:ribonuclease BN (tRNA processing enzyme)
VKLTVVGCSPAWPNPGGAHSGYLVQGSGSLLLDCGPGVLGRLRGMYGWPELEAIVITHFHLDHWGDLVPWVWGALYLRSHGDVPPRPRLFVPPTGIAQLETFGSLLGFPDMFERVFEVEEYEEGVPFEADGHVVTATRVQHYRMAAYALRVRDDDTTLAYSADAGPGPQLVEVARDADLFLCEATLRHGDLDGEPRGHLSLEEAEAVFEESGAKRLLLTHRPAELPVPAGRQLAHDGLVVEL